MERQIALAILVRVNQFSTELNSRPTVSIRSMNSVKLLFKAISKKIIESLVSWFLLAQFYLSGFRFQNFFDFTIYYLLFEVKDLSKTFYTFFSLTCVLQPPTAGLQNISFVSP